MSYANKVLAVSNALPIRTSQPIHSGKVRSVYWLSDADSQRLIKQEGYNVAADAQLAVMVISDRLSAFECIWQAEGGMQGVPGKGAALNAISNHWFELFREKGLANSHILAVPHPLVWIVQKAKPVMIEAIARQYITGSMWRAYSKGERTFCGIELGDDLQQNQKLPELLITPSTKGILQGIPGVPEADDVNVTRTDIENNYQAFKFNRPEDINVYESLLQQGFAVISEQLEKLDQIFVDTKFEFGYVNDTSGQQRLIYMDEIGTPDSSRIWDGEQYCQGNIVENSKEGFRQMLLNYFDDTEILLNKNRMTERLALAKNNPLPLDMLMQVSAIYTDIAKKITGKELSLEENPESEIIEIMRDRYQLID